jgi:PRTRC genetic system protein E
MPLLVGRTVMITVAREDDKAVRVCIIPRKGKDDENPALTTPLSYTGTPEELDAELGKHLAGYVECHTQLGSTLAQAKAEMDAAAKAQDEARKRAADRGKRATEKQAANTDSAPAAPAPPPPPATMTLFGGSQPTIAPASAANPTATAAGGGGESTCRLAL